MKTTENTSVVQACVVLATNHTVSLEPFATELLGGAVWGVGPLNGDTIVVGVLKVLWYDSVTDSASSYLLTVGEGIAGNGEKNGFLWIEDSAWWIDAKTFHVGGLDSVSDATSRRVDHLDVVGVLVVVRGIEDDLGVWLGLDVSWWDGLSHGD